MNVVNDIATTLPPGPRRAAYLAAMHVPTPASSASPGARNDGLSPREVEVLQLVASGLTDAEVGLRLSISHRTVGHHLESIYSKLGVGSRTAASAFAYAHGLLDRTQTD